MRLVSFPFHSDTIGAQTEEGQSVSSDRSSNGPENLSEADLQREFSEYAKLARLRIPFVSDGYRHALDAYRQARQDPTPLMIQASKNAATGSQP